VTNESTGLNADAEMFQETNRSAFLDHMVDHLVQKDPKGEQLKMQHLVDETLSVIINGFDTVTLTINYVLCNLGKHPSIREKIYQEILETNIVDLDELECFPSLIQYIEETLRLQNTM